MSTVSWDHFFNSLHQYYSGLRQEAPLSTDMAHVYRHSAGGSGLAGGTGITPQEVAGLVAWLRLAGTVAQHDDTARLAMADNQQWLPLVVLLGLVACSVPARLKAALLQTLAVLAKAPEVAASLWHAIENARVSRCRWSSARY